MLHDPEILILDEPTSGLDPNQIVEIRNLIREIGKKKTVILSTHILSEVEATCDRVIIIDKGDIIADSTTSELRSTAGKEARIAVRIRGAQFDELAAAVRALDGVSGVAQRSDDEGLTSALVTVRAAADIRPDIFSIVKDRGWVLYEMTRERKTLEHVFRELTKGGDNEI
jgi:ABC-2 type transport system ATP-binding protein